MSNRYLYECQIDQHGVTGFVKTEVMSRVVELNRQGCTIACKRISSKLSRE